MVTLATRKTTGRAMTARVRRSQNPPRGSNSESTRARLDRRGQLMRSPSTASSAGSSVIEAPSAAIVTRIAPPASARKIVVGMMSIPASARTTVRPLKNTARLAVAPAAPMASSLTKPFFRSSR